MPLTPSTNHDERPELTADSATTSLFMARPPTKKSDCERVRFSATSPTITGRKRVITKTMSARGSESRS